MPFPYRYVCDLLQQLEEETRSTSKERTPSHTIIERWFHEHRIRLDAPTVNGCAVISTLLPERRTDRVYGIQAPRLESIIGQALILGSSRVKELRRYKTSGQGVDLGDCVESILSRAPNSVHPEREVTVEDLDEALTRVAAGCRFSSPAIRASYKSPSPQSDNHVLGQFFTRLSPRDAKWFARLILKNYQPIVLEERVVLRSHHVLLPRMLKVRDDLQIATDFLQHLGASSNDPKVIASLLKPVLGTKVGRPPWLKARSIRNCLDIVGSRQVSCEQKIDGEYCQVHADLSNKHSPIQIFSKSGKDSTQDRRRLHSAIRDSLRLGQQDCPFKMGCILEGELVVYSTKDNKILPFHKIRKHVSRSGSYIGSKNDSQRHDYEHLMIIYYDILLVDTQSMLGMKHSERFKRLERLITCRKGHAEIVQRQIISFSRHSAAFTLREMFAKCIVGKGEGLVLKPDEPYFDFGLRQSRFSSCVVKMKKEYVQGWGDVGDFAVIGASYDATKAKTYDIPKLKWTHFFIGCLANKGRAQARSEKPAFVVTNIVELPETLLQTLRMQCEPRAVPFDDNNSFVLDFRGTGNSTKPTEVFLNPPVFDIRCFSFDKESNSRSWSMRFPYVSKIHFDRSYLDTISFAELQQAAYTATEAPELEDSQEMRHWISALEKADPRGRAVDKLSQETVSTCVSSSDRPSSSPVKSTRNDRLMSIALEPVTEMAPRNRPGHKSNRPNGGLATPPRSSAVEIKDPADPTDVVSLDDGPRVGKRTTETLGADPISKKQCRSISANDENTNSARPLLTNSLAYPSRDRRPLGSIDGNKSPIDRRPSFQNAPGLFVRTPRHQAMPSSPLGENGIVSSAAGSFHTANELPSSPPQRMSTPYEDRPEKPAALSIDPEAQVQEGCAHKGPECAFNNSSILLAPCISNYAWVTEDLLKTHGVVDFEVDPEAWKQRPSSSGVFFSSSPRVTSDTLGQTQRIVKGGRVRKICLVETRRPEATHEFLKRIERTGLTRRNGKREWVAVYDWKILEDFANIEAGVVQKGPDPWRQRYVGIA
ncbi:ATP dependent DNA ligase domain-containing protein [Apiospora rasikravindrae]|uniref:ATP dependent DNA ligase domain-containing protein n=1 Tax=Apiospora rasikravindrae TaxID=990691 RepID=A0ABR1SKY8_9PEZI